jgi:hypothetical protein
VSALFASIRISSLLLVNSAHNVQIVDIWYARQTAATLVNVQRTPFGMVCNVQIKDMKTQIAQAIKGVEKISVCTVRTCISVQVGQHVLHTTQQQ